MKYRFLNEAEKMWRFMKSSMVALKVKDRYFNADGLKLHYAEWGEPGPDSVILIHGNRDHSRSWDFFVEAMVARSERFRHFIALDLRGHGDSDWSPPGRGYQHEDFLFDLDGLLRHLHKNSATIVAHSLGGSMALLFAGCFSTRVEKLVLVEAAGPYARAAEDVPDILAERLEGKGSDAQKTCYATLEEAAAALKKRFSLIPAEVCAHMARHGTRNENGGWFWKHDPRLRFRSQSTLSEEQIRAFIDRIDCPTLLVFGAESGFLQSPRAPRAALFKNSKLIEVAKTGHHVPHERPDELAELTLSFLTAA